MARLLVIDDEKAILDLVKNGLEKDGHIVAICGSATDVAVDRLKDYDLILLDIMMPDVDGFMFCKKIRGLVDCPILFLTAKVLETDIIYGLGLGADDYITKPFPLSVLISKVHAVMKRVDRAEKIIRSGQVEFLLTENRVKKNGEYLSLTANEQKLLERFMRNPQKILSKNQLLEAVWDLEGSFVDENTLAVNIRRLREKIEEDPSNPCVIKNIRGLGYIWEKECEIE